MSILIIPFTVISVAAIALALIPHFRLNNLAPLLGEGAKELLLSAGLKFGGFFELVFFFVFSGWVSDYKSFKKAGLIGVGLISLITAGFTLMYCAAIPYPASKNFFFPLYQLTRLIKSGAFIQRLEPLIIFIWAGIVLCSLTSIVHIIRELLRASTNSADGASGLIPLIVMLIFLGGTLPDSQLDVYDSYKTMLDITHVVYLIAGLLILLIARGRKIEAS